MTGRRTIWILTLVLAVGLLVFWRWRSDHASHPAVVARTDAERTALAQLEAERVALEDQRRLLASEQRAARVRFVAGALTSPAAYVRAASAAGAVKPALDAALSDSQRQDLSALGTAMVPECERAEECRVTVADLTALAQDAERRQKQIEEITAKVGYRLLVTNFCNAPVRLAITYTTLDGQPRSLWWSTLEPDRQSYLTVADEPFRSRVGTISYYAETQSRTPNVAWTGDSQQIYDGTRYGARTVNLTPGDELTYTLALNCDGAATQANGAEDTASAWILPPILAGDWRAVDGNEATALAASLRTELGNRSLPIGRIYRMRKLDLPFYRGVSLVEAEAALPNDRRGIYTFLHHDLGISLLEGKADPIHVLNGRQQIFLDNAAQVEAYLRFFVASIAGPDGSFAILDSAAQLPWTPDATMEVLRVTQSLVRPPAVRRDDDGKWRVETSTKYGRSILDSTYQVQSDGTMRMELERPRAETLPVVPDQFTDGVRVAP
jgi:hypothetical protein